MCKVEIKVIQVVNNVIILITLSGGCNLYELSNYTETMIPHTY